MKLRVQQHIWRWEIAIVDDNDEEVFFSAKQYAHKRSAVRAANRFSKASKIRLVEVV